MRLASVALNTITVRGLMISCITHYAPEVFTKVDKNGRRFRCGDTFVRDFIHRELDWSFRKATRAGQKIPIDAEQQLFHASLRMAGCIRDENVKACFVVNGDQTLSVYASGRDHTYELKGSKQINIVGIEEKRAFTVMVGVSMSGEVLPLQAIFTGVDPNRSLPKPTAPKYDEARKLGFRFEVSKTKTHWSNHGTMHLYVQHILAPYFEKHKARLNLPNQRCIWLIDVWSVHRSKEFRTWMKTHYPWIIILYVPGGCTGLAQPCDVGIQRPFKHAMRRTAHSHVIDETLAQLRTGAEARDIRLEKNIGPLRDRCVEWLVNGYHAINDPVLVKKVRRSFLCSADVSLKWL